MRIITALLLLSSMYSCTDNQRARSFGGTETFKLSPNEKFINITWKKDNLWVIVQDTITGDYKAIEKSSFGIMQGQVIITK